ncbi:unnamed protein product [Pocillopora meandrina]|uniref:dCMP deaminase n=1 Tax=Pocillopora meandrina TaxID=46732 RepID=A0AAU9X170_9CNID|nr:unnamed protein product [Pocillopora meandrina]
MKQTKRSTWVEYYRDVAFCVSMRSKDPSLQVGCVTVHPKSLRILSAGYNGFPPGTPNKEENWRKGTKDDLVVHAEANAVLLAGQADLEGSIAFVTMYPCRECAKMLITKGVRKVYYLSLKKKYQADSTAIFKEAGVEVVPIKRGEDTTLEDYGNYLTKKVGFVLEQNRTRGEPNGAYKALWDGTEELRSSDLQSPWRRKLMGKILLDKWTDYFLFLALIASTRALKNPQGAILIDSKTLKISALSYNGYPGSVSNKSPEWMEVSALTKAICLRFSEGRDFIAFSTHFPNLHEVKNLAQAQVKTLYFMWPKTLEGDGEKALQIMKDAGMKVVPMDVPNLVKLGEAIKNTIEGLQEAEKGLSSGDWPSDTWTEYDLQPEQHHWRP